MSPRRAGKASRGPITIGMDLGDKTSRYGVLDDRGELAGEGSVATTKKALAEKLGGLSRTRIAMEVGAHSPWVSRLLAALGHEAIVANARRVRLISESSSKDDKLDARMPARLARIDPELLRPIRHRLGKSAVASDGDSGARRAGGHAHQPGEQRRADWGERLPACDADALNVAKLCALPEAMKETLRPLLEQVESLTEKIKQADAQIEQIARIEYPETKLLRQVSGVGVLIALTFVLTVEDSARFEKSRDLGCYVGLRPKRSESGQSQPRLRITKEGDRYLRKMLVQGAHLILNRRGPDTDLKHWGLRLAGRGGKNQKKRAVVAVARKLAVLLHRLWVTAEVYQPLRHRQQPVAA